MTPDNREEQVREALGRVTQMVAPGAEWVEIEAADWATIRAHIEALEARVRELEGVLRDAPTTLAYAINMCNGVASEALQDEAMRRVNAYNARVKAAMQGEEVRGG